jgi:hypothetical protein
MVKNGIVFMNEKKEDAVSWYTRNNQNIHLFPLHRLLSWFSTIPPVQLVRLFAVILGTYLFVRMLVHTVNSQVEPKETSRRRKYKAQPSPIAIANTNRPVTRSMTKTK